jgi:hypothetical protein
MTLSVIRSSFEGIFIDLPIDAITGSPEITIKSVEGLGPVRSPVNMQDYALLDGAALLGVRAGVRNIVITLKLTPAYELGSTVETLRNKLYDHFMPKSNVHLDIFRLGYEAVMIDGVVESCDPPIFSKDNEMVISIICVNPYFISTTGVVINGVTNTQIDVPYLGTIPSGFITEVAINGATNPVYITRFATPAVRIAEVAYIAPLVAGDQLSISSVEGAKWTYVTKGGTTLNKLGSLSSDGLHWPVLRKGPNPILINANRAGMPFQISYRARYGGL